MECYVSKDKLTEAVYLSMHDNPHKDGKSRVMHNNEHMHFVNMIYHMPSADVRPVVHGRWVCLEPEIGYFACSECDHRILRAKSNYCPNCGATMDLERQGMDECLKE